MTNIGEMDTISTVLNTLKLRGYHHEFTLTENGMVLIEGKEYSRHECKIVRTYRFEGNTDPGDEAIIYIIETGDGTNAYSLDAYGVYTNHYNDGFFEFIRRMEKENSDVHTAEPLN